MRNTNHTETDGYSPTFEMPNKGNDFNSTGLVFFVGACTGAMLAIMAVFIALNLNNTEAYAENEKREFEEVIDAYNGDFEELEQTEEENEGQSDQIEQDANDEEMTEPEGTDQLEETFQPEEFQPEEFQPVEPNILEYDQPFYYEEETVYVDWDSYYTSTDAPSLQVDGVQYSDDGVRYTWYSENVLPGYGLDIPGRHVDEDGFVTDEDGNICVASSDYEKGTVLETPYGTAVVYDTGCPNGTVDIYTSW